MKIKLNGVTTEVDDGATLGDIITGVPHVEEGHVAVIRSVDQVREETKEYEVVTDRGSMVLALNNSRFADKAKRIFSDLRGKRIRWQTSRILAIGAFPTDIEVKRGTSRYSRYDCFFALGGFDSSTTYIMIAKQDHEGDYGVEGGVLGRITRGRHLLPKLEETETIREIRPIVVRTTAEDAFSTDDLSVKLDEGASVETYIRVKLNEGSPISAEHFLVTSSPGYIRVTDKTATYSATSENMDVSLPSEEVGVRDEKRVTVRHEGAGEGRVYFYHQRRQLSSAHSIAGTVVEGSNLISLAPRGAKLVVLPDPGRVMTIGMTQAEGQRFLASRGIRQVRTGETDDEAVIVEQEPELTIEALRVGEVETLGVRPEKIYEVEFIPKGSPKSVSYVKKITGLDHKPIGTLQVHFTYPGLPIVTFEGNLKAAGSLVPERTFDEISERGDLGVTNMSRPQRGLVGLRLEASKEFGPTGEERYGTNVVGRLISDIDQLIEELREGDIIYIRERKEEDEREGRDGD